jgi:hypothetical protein
MKLFIIKHKNDRSARQPKFGNEHQGYVFRRSRTLTGTTSPKVATSNEARSQLKTKRLQVHELHQLRNRILRILCMIVVVVAVLCYIVANYIGNIQLVYTQPGGKPLTSNYQQSVLGYFDKHPLERFGFTVNAKQLAFGVQAAHPELISVDVDRNWYGGSVQFILSFRRPVLVWETGGHRFYVDDHGVAFEYDHFGGKYVSVIDQSGISPSASGGTVASNHFINFLGKMVGAVNAAGKGSVTEIVIPASTREVDLKLEGRGYPIKTHTDRDPLQQAQDIMTTLKWLDDKNLKPEYVDVRVSGRAYFK